ncbi:MAG: VOC family protein [Opitutales bacterium]|nr:VOC family protein [Opitutales bacterium]
MDIKDLKLAHIGVAVADMTTARQVYIENGYLCGNVVYDPVQKVNICFAEKPDEPRVELIEAAAEDAPVRKILENGEPAVAYHVCYAVADLEKSIADLRKENWLLVKNPVPAVACGNARVAFLYSQSAGLIELLEEDKK